MNPISNKVLKKIKSEKVKMRPKIYFVLRGVLIALSIVFVILFVLYLVSFVFFSLRISGVWYLPRFGFPGLGIFLVSFPWLLIVIAILLIIVLEVLVKRFSFTYRRPILYSILGIVILVFLVSFIIGRTQLHSELFWRAREGRLPVIGEFYRGYGMPGPRDVHHGMISGITDDGFQVEKTDGQIVNIIITDTTRFPSGADFEEGDMVVVFGKQDNSIIKASGIIKADEEFKDFISPRGPRSPRPMPFR